MTAYLDIITLGKSDKRANVLMLYPPTGPIALYVDSLDLEDDYRVGNIEGTAGITFSKDVPFILYPSDYVTEVDIEDKLKAMAEMAGKPDEKPQTGGGSYL